MKNYLEKTNKKFPMLMMLFIMIQPLIDLLTSYSKLILEINITPGIIIRFLFMFTGGVYIIFKAVKGKEFKYVVYLLFLAIFFLVNLFISYKFKPVFDLYSEIISIGKIVYFVVMFIISLLVFKDLKDLSIERKYFPLNIAVSQLIISVSIVVAKVTNTNIEAYDGILKSGNSGWFFSGNELGSLLAICFPILIWFALNQKNLIRLLLSWLIVLGSGYSLIELGTKVGYLSIAITLGMMLISVVLELFIKGSSNIQSNKHFKVLLAIGTTFIFVVLTPYMPVTKNTNSHFTHVETQVDINDNGTKDSEKTIDEVDDLPRNDNEKKQIINELIYSGRDGFEQRHRQDFNESNYLQKNFGLGYSANYKDKPVTIERDFHDLFYQFGILGTPLILVLFIWNGFKIIIYSIRKIKDVLNVKFFMLYSGILLGFGIGFISGHVLTAPAVSTYLVLIFAYTVTELESYMINKSLRKIVDAS